LSLVELTPPANGLDRDAVDLGVRRIAYPVIGHPQGGLAGLLREYEAWGHPASEHRQKPTNSFDRRSCQEAKKTRQYLALASLPRSFVVRQWG
jgi:hypothetical protein